MPSSGPFFYFHPISNSGKKLISGQVDAILSEPHHRAVLSDNSTVLPGRVLPGVPFTSLFLE
jgi:hypothetical protein